MTGPARLRELLASDDIVIAPGAYDGLTAKLIQAAGFPALYMTGGGVSAAAGHPDVNILTGSEVAAKAREIASAVDIPVIADADTGFGGLVNVRRTVRDLESAGVAGLHLEDQPFPKRCGYLERGSLVPVDEMCRRIDVAVQARRDPDLVVIARSEAEFASSFDESVERLNAYRAAGADVLFLCGMRDADDARRLITEVPGVHLFNYSGSNLAPKIGPSELAAIGYRICIYTIQGQRLMAKAYQDMLVNIKNGGDMQDWEPKMLTWEEWTALSGVPEFNEFEKRYL